MSALLSQITVWQAVRAMFWVCLIPLPLLLCLISGFEAGISGESSELAKFIFWVAFILQTILIGCFYTGVIK